MQQSIASHTVSRFKRKEFAPHTIKSFANAFSNDRIIQNVYNIQSGVNGII
jgi:hypothetical protein